MQAIFASGGEASGPSSPCKNVLQDWVVRRVAQFLLVLDRALLRVTDRINLILGQCMVRG